MRDKIESPLSREYLKMLLKANLACFLEKKITMHNIDSIVNQIIESIDYVINDQKGRKEYRKQLPAI